MEALSMLCGRFPQAISSANVPRILLEEVGNSNQK
jgi:hypothetical protein